MPVGRIRFLAATVAYLGCASLVAATPLRIPCVVGSAVPTPPFIRSAISARGGASKNKRRRRGGQTATLHSSKGKEEKKSATGRRSVGNNAEEKKPALSSLASKFGAVTPATRLYMGMVGVATLIGLFGENAQALMALDPMRTIHGLELWRPLSAMSYMGPPSIGLLMSGYYLYEYGSTLERMYGTAQLTVFFVTQLVLLTFASVLLGQPFFGTMVLTAMLHVLSRQMPFQKVKWLIFNVPYWTLPLGLMATDVLQAQSPGAALPHILGILTGHFYHFHKNVYTKLGGEDWLDAPNYLRSRLDGDGNGDKKEKVVKRKRGKGRKLGS